MAALIRLARLVARGLNPGIAVIVAACGLRLRDSQRGWALRQEGARRRPHPNYRAELLLSNVRSPVRVPARTTAGVDVPQT